MKKIFIMIMIVLLLCSCVSKDNTKVDEVDELESEIQRLEISEAFILSYTEKNTKEMKPLVSKRFSFPSGGIKMESTDPKVELGILSILGNDLEYEFISSHEDKGYYYYTYQLVEKIKTGNINGFKIQIGIKEIEDSWKVDDFFMIME